MQGNPCLMLMLADETMHHRVEAVPSSVASVRREVADLAARLGGTEQQVDAVRLAVSEAVTNAVVHAYRGKPGIVTVTTALAAGELWVLVSDEGCGHQAPAERPGLGWGLALIAEAADSFAVVERAEGGTEVRMGFRLGGPQPRTAASRARPAADGAAADAAASGVPLGL